MDSHFLIWLSYKSLLSLVVLLKLFLLKLFQLSNHPPPPFFFRNAVKTIRFASQFSGIVMVKLIVQRDQMKEAVPVNIWAWVNASLWIIQRLACRYPGSAMVIHSALTMTATFVLRHLKKKNVHPTSFGVILKRTQRRSVCRFLRNVTT